MKKLSVLIAMILCVTIGGVYAAWTYSSATAEITGSSSVGLNLSAATQAGAAGSFAVTENVASLEISETSTTDKTAVLDVRYTTETDAGVKISIEFVPAATANDTLKAKGVTTYVYIGTNDNITITDKDLNEVALFNFEHGKDNAIVINEALAEGQQAEEGKYYWEDNGGTFICTIELSLTDFVSLANFSLDNINDYEAFYAAMKGTKEGATADIHIHVTTINPKPVAAE